MNDLKAFVHEQVDRLMAEHAEHSPELGLAVSGGTDSRALLELMHDYPAALHVIHVNHGLRPSAADEAERVRAAAEAHALGCTVYCYTQDDHRALPKIGPEARARCLRFRAFNDWLKGGKRVILLAHHAEDQAETVLLNLFRGTSGQGLCGMRAVRGNFWRPLLSLRRTELAAYLQERSIQAIEDESNRDPAMSRNRIRYELMPLLKDIFVRDPVTMLTRTADSIREERLLFTELLHTAYGEYLKDSRGIYQAVPAARPGLLRAILAEVLPTSDLSRRHYTAAAECLQKASYRYLDFPHFIFASYRGYYTWGEDEARLRHALIERVRADYPQCTPDQLLRLPDERCGAWTLRRERGELPPGVWGLQIEDAVFNELHWETLETLEEDRCRRRAELKKLGVPGPVRERLPLCFRGRELIWVPGFKIARKREGDCSLKWIRAEAGE